MSGSGFAFSKEAIKQAIRSPKQAKQTSNATKPAKQGTQARQAKKRKAKQASKQASQPRKERTNLQNMTLGGGDKRENQITTESRYQGGTGRVPIDSIAQVGASGHLGAGTLCKCVKSTLELSIPTPS